MRSIRRSEERGHGEHGWLSSRHTFSFADYHDPAQMGYRTLRVINEDRVAPGRGFGTHPHRDMEIISYVLEGALEHADSLGTGSVIQVGDVQRMTAGSGVTHSEYNHSKTAPVHFLQIWILPERRGLPPSYEQKHFTEAEKRGRLRLVASREGEEGSVVVHQDMRLYASLLEKGEAISYTPKDGRYTWVHVAKGELSVQGERLKAGDAYATDESEALTFESDAGAEFLLFDLA